MGDECYFCEDSDDLEEHHILPQRFEGSDAESNVVDVCHDCHWKLERLYNKDFWHALGIDDPRATRETHLVCYTPECQKQATQRLRLRNRKGEGAAPYHCDEHAEQRKQRESWVIADRVDHTGDQDENDSTSDAAAALGVDEDELDTSRNARRRYDRLTDH